MQGGVYRGRARGLWQWHGSTLLKPRPDPMPQATANHVAAAKHATAAAHHLAAGGDRAGYWRLMAESDQALGRDAEHALQLATRYQLGLIR